MTMRIANTAYNTTQHSNRLSGRLACSPGFRPAMSWMISNMQYHAHGAYALPSSLLRSQFQRFTECGMRAGDVLRRYRPSLPSKHDGRGPSLGACFAARGRISVQKG